MRRPVALADVAYWLMLAFILGGSVWWGLYS